MNATDRLLRWRGLGTTLGPGEFVAARFLTFLKGFLPPLALGAITLTAQAQYQVETVVNWDGTLTIQKAASCPSGALIIPDAIDGRMVTGIGGWAFQGCSGLTAITIPDSVNRIDHQAFKDCPNLISIAVDPSNAAFSSSDGVLFDKSRTMLIAYPGGRAGSYAIPRGVTSIEPWAVYGCTGLTSVTIPDSVESVGVSSFSGCTGLTSVTIGNGVTSIGDRAFSDCSSLTGITLPDSITTIGEEAFSFCIGLTNVTIGNGVTSIGHGAFWGSNGLSAILVQPSNPAFSSLNGVLFRACPERPGFRGGRW